MRRILALAVGGAVGVLLLWAVPAHTGGGGHACRQPVTDRQGPTVNMGASCFTPTVARVPTGGLVTWVNQDQFPHTVTGANLAWGSQVVLQAGQGVSQRFPSPGVYPYYCLLHPGMIGAVVVGNATAPSP